MFYYFVQLTKYSTILLNTLLDHQNFENAIFTTLGTYWRVFHVMDNFLDDPQGH